MRRGILNHFVRLSGIALLAAACTASLGDGANNDDDGAASSGQGGTASGTPSSSSSTGGSTGGAGAGGPVAPSDINTGWVGGPCASHADCPYDGGFCLFDEDGFPEGMCALDCSQFCPDQDGAVTTFCVSPAQLGASAGEGLCTTRCDYGQSPTGCRRGYQCNVASRYGDADTEIYACVPGEDAPFELGSCHQELVDRGVAFSPAVNPNDSPEGMPNVICEIEEPIYVSPHLGGVAFHPSSLDNEPTPIFTRCRHALAMLDTAEVLAEEGVDALVHYGVYSCRTIAGTSTLSEHASANAIDIAGLRKNGNYWTVLSDWEMGQPSPVTPAGQLLRSFVDTLHDEVIYNIILTPEYNAAHEDHFHCDLTEGAHFLE